MAGLIRLKSSYYITYYLGGKEKRRSLRTKNLQVAKEKVRQLESALARNEDVPFPTRTRIPDVVAAYTQHIANVKTYRSARTDCYYLREMFGPVCPALEIKSRKGSQKARRRRLGTGSAARRPEAIIEANCFEEITTAQISAFISAKVQTRGIAPKTANRYREILTRLFNWAMKERGIRLPGDKNPAAAVERYREQAPTIRFLTLPQIDEQMRAIAFNTPIREMVAMYIYAGLRREEALWLQRSDVDLNAGPNGMIRIRAKEVNGVYWEPKTKRNRAIPISNALRTHLERYTPCPSDGDWYFPSPKGNHYDPDNFSRHLRGIQKRAGLPWGCLDFRHTFGSQLAMKGESLYKISTLMGNSPEICRRHYAALIPEAMYATVDFSTDKNKITCNKLASMLPGFLGGSLLGHIS